MKINSKTLEPSDLKKYDKQEKEGIASNGAVLKGKTRARLFLMSDLRIVFVERRNFLLSNSQSLSQCVDQQLLFQHFCAYVDVFHNLH